MLVIKKFNSKKEKIDYFLSNFDIKKSGIIVADLESKKSIQTLLLNKHGYLLNASLWRAGDVWKNLFSKFFPDWHVLSYAGGFICIEKYLKQLSIKNLSVLEVLNGIKQTLPLLTHAQFNEAMEEYKKNYSADSFWLEKFASIKTIWEQFKIDKLTLEPWLSSQLLYVSSFEGLLPEKIYVDLSYEIDVIEKELLATISKQCDVEFFEMEKKALTPMSSVHHETPLDEIKYAVAKLRAWYESGVKLSDIIILASDLESYWPALRALLKTEGIPYNKNWVYNFSSDLNFSHWISKLKLSAGLANKSDIEMGIFYSDEVPATSKLDFDKYYKNNLSLDWQDPLKLNKSDVKVKEDENNISNFLNWISHFKKDNLADDKFEKVILTALNDIPKNLNFNLAQWINYLELVISRSEGKLDDSHFSENGVKISNLMGDHWLMASHKIYLGVSEANLQVERHYVFPPGELLRLANLYGFPVETEKVYSTEPYIVSEPLDKTVLSYAKLSFDGTEQVPSVTWLRASPSKDINAKTVWQTQKKIVNANKIKYQSFKKISLSPSSVEKYLECPAKLYFAKVLKLDDDQSIDVELDPRQRGSLYHKICEELIKNNLNLKEQSVEEFVTTCIEQSEIFFDKSFFDSILKRYVSFTNRFIEFEKNLKLKFPDRSNLATELSFQIYYDLASKKFTTEPNESSWLVRGKIDRIDQDKQGQILVIDYKSSTSSYSTSQKWLEDGTWQLILYSYLIDSKKIILNEKNQVVGAVYFSLKDFDASKSFLLGEKINDLMEVPSKRSASFWTEEEKFKLYAEFEVSFYELVKKINDGNFDPSPRDLDLCQTCEWRLGCQASHLQ